MPNTRPPTPPNLQMRPLANGRSGWARVVVASLAVVVAAFFVRVYYAYSTSHLNLDQKPLVYDVHGSPLLTSRIAFGNAQACGDHPCFAEPDFNEHNDFLQWLPVEIPDAEHRPLPLAQTPSAAAGGLPLALRLELEIPKDLLASPHAIAFAPLYIDARHIKLFINGHLTYEAEGESRVESNTIVTIPRSFIQGGKVVLAITGMVDQPINPIGHRYKLYLGPKADIEFLHRATANFRVNYHMLATFSKGSVFIIFALIFLYTRATPGFRFFLIYAFGATLENPIIGHNDMLGEWQIPIYFQVKTMMTGALLQYFCVSFHRRRDRRIAWWLWGALHPLVLGLSLWANTEPPKIPVSEMLKITNAIYLLVFAYAVYHGWRYLALLRAKAVESLLYQSTRNFVLFISVYGALVLYQSFFITYRGDELRLFLDLAFFFYIALANARATGLNEGRILTLEGHYAEKVRMEQELREAGMISRAFLPSSPPNWPAFAIDVFHRSISEASGDWYAFEASADRRLFHVVMCDITGHGVQAALIVSTCKTVWSNLIAADPEASNRSDFLALFAAMLADTLYRHGDGHHTSTMVGLTFAPDAGLLYCINAGHPAPFIIDDQTPPQLKQLVARGNPLGLNAAAQWQMRTAPLRPGQTMIIYTDGVPLAANLRTLRQFFQARATDTIGREGMARDLYESIWRDHAARTGGAPDDDVSLISIRYLAGVAEQPKNEGQSA